MENNAGEMKQKRMHFVVAHSIYISNYSDEIYNLGTEKTSFCNHITKLIGGKKIYIPKELVSQM